MRVEHAPEGGLIGTSVARRLLRRVPFRLEHLQLVGIALQHFIRLFDCLDLLLGGLIASAIERERARSIEPSTSVSGRRPRRSRRSRCLRTRTRWRSSSRMWNRLLTISSESLRRMVATGSKLPGSYSLGMKPLTSASSIIRPLRSRGSASCGSQPVSSKTFRRTGT
ncbi:hypothetical protein BC361_00180 [Ensifer sp. LC54]|nr:hypothetical protein BC363_06700 [Ensifer sp. LC384]OCP27872.1 hypothetical protein BC361_00180 [Ensifer sp. LC54]